MSKELPGAIYEPSDYSSAEDMIDLLGLQEGDSILDLGAGDGRVVMNAASRGIDAFGSEIDPKLVAKSRKNIAENGLSHIATIYQRSFWEEDFGKYNALTIFQSPFVMGPLQEKILRECKKGTRIVSNTWSFPDLKPVATRGKIKVYII